MSEAAALPDGDDAVVLGVRDATVTVTVVRVAHRGSAYTGLDNL